MPSLAKATALTTDDPLPVKTTLATVLSTVKSVVETLLLKVVVPPTFCSVKVVTPAIAPLAVISAPAILFSVVKVKVLLPPVTAAMVMSAALELALVSMVTLLPKVTAPRTTASFDVALVPFKVTVPPTLVVVSPPL